MPTSDAPATAARALRRRRAWWPSTTRHEVALAAITLVWGTTFLTVQRGLALSGPFGFVAIRFGIAALVLAALSARTLAGVTRRELAVGSLVGVALVLGYGLQTVGLRTIPSSTSAFLTALYVPLVPLLDWLVRRRRPTTANAVGIALAFVGVLLVTGASAAGLHVGRGEAVTMVGAVAIAAEVVLIGCAAGTVDPRRVTVVQLAVCSLLALLAMPVTGERLPVPTWALLAFTGGLGVATAVIQVTINWAQRSVSPVRATVIYSAEPVWAGVVGRIAGERLAATSVVGGALVVLAVLVSELKPRWRAPQPERATPVGTPSRP